MDWLVTGVLTIVVNIILWAVLSAHLHRQYNSRAFLDSMRKEMDLLMTEMNQGAERNVAIMEDRVRKLKALMEELDRKLVLVRKEEERGAATGYGTVRDRIMEARRIETRQAGSIPAGPVSMSVAPVAPPPDAAPVPRESRRELRARVLQLYRAGMDPLLIARQTGLTPGETELMISLGDREEP